MDDATVARYDELAREWIESSHPEAVEVAAALGRSLDGPCADLGCGPGWHLDHLGIAAIGLDASGPMAREAALRSGQPIVQGDLEHLPFVSGSLAGAWAAKSYVHLPRTSVPMAWRELHRVVRVGGTVAVQLFRADRDDVVGGRKVPGRVFNFWTDERLDDALTGAGFTPLDTHPLEGRGLDADRDITLARRERTLADSVGPDMSVLLCGLNPSLHAADAGYGFAGPSNRFWPAALASGLVTVERDPVAALRRDRIGMTDLVKRATARAGELTTAEYSSGFGRLHRLCHWLRPSVVCVVGITGWRAASGDATAGLGLQPIKLGGRPVYVMPNPSGLNAHTNHDDLVAHFEEAQRLADRAG